MALDLDDLPGDYLRLWRERHLCTLSTLRPDGTIHTVPVGATYDPDAKLVRVICRRSSRKARNVAAYGPEGGHAAVSFVDGRRWATMEGRAVLSTDRDRVAEAERRYSERYRTPRPQPERVVIEIRVTRALGSGGSQP